MKFKILLLCLFVSFNSQALPRPAGAPAATTAQSPEALFANSITELYQYGPGIWSNPGFATMTEFNIVTRVHANPATANPFGSGLDRNPVLDIATPYVPTPLAAGNYIAADFEDHLVDLTGAQPLLNFGPAVSLGNPLINALSVMFNIADVVGTGAPPNPITINEIPHTSLARMGFFNGSLLRNSNEPWVWSNDYLILYDSLRPGAGQDFIHPRSRGKLLMDAMRSYAGALNAANQFGIRQVLNRHNKRFASFRAIGLNPMWDIVNPTTSGAHGAIPPRVSDYILNSYARFFYNESYRHIDNNFAPNALWVMYRTFANMLAYESGHMNMRYAPLDPSCREPVGNTCAPTGIPQVILDNPQLTNFGSPNEFAIVYDLLKYLNSDPGQANAAALNMAGTNNVNPVSGTVNGRMGSAMPTDMDSLVALAQSIFNRAWNIQQALPPQFGGSNLLVPRASAAFVLAAAVAGKRVDPVFWGYLAEAEQATFKVAFGNYKNLVDSWFASVRVKNDYALSLSDFGTYRPLVFAPPQDVAAGVAFPNTGLGQLLATVRDGTSGRMALIRGPAGLMSLQGDRFEAATAYKKVDDTFAGNPVPNANIEMAQSGRAILDGDLLFPTNNGVARHVDIDNVTLTNNRMPFERAVLGSYDLDSNIIIGGTAAQAAAQSAQTRGRSNGGASGIAVLQEEYKTLTGRFRPISRFSSDSRYFLPALQYWLVISDKLNSNGLDPLANINPPQFANINNMYQNEINKGAYRIKNLANVAYTDSRTPRANLAVPAIPNPLGNILPLDAYHHAGFVMNQFPLTVQAAFERTLAAPFISPTNDYVPSPANGGAYPSVNDAPDPDAIVPAVPASGAGSIDCARLGLFEGGGPIQRDMSVPCP